MDIRKIKVILWDNDGVLVDTEHLYFLATKQILATLGITLTKARYRELFLIQGKGAWHLAAENGVSPGDIEQLRQKRNKLYGKLLSEESLVIAGVRDVLAALSGKFVMGIVTSSRPDHFAIIHRSSDLLPYFQFVLARSDYTHSKPHPEPYLLAVERSGFRKEECLVIEDSERGLLAAKAAGLQCIVVPNEFTCESNFSGAYKVLENVSDLLLELS